MLHKELYMIMLLWVILILGGFILIAIGAIHNRDVMCYIGLGSWVIGIIGAAVIVVIDIKYKSV